MARSLPEHYVRVFGDWSEHAELCTALANGSLCLRWMATNSIRFGQMEFWRAYLPDCEWRRALKFRREIDRVGYVSGRVMLRCLASALMDIDPITVSLEPNQNGKPELRSPKGCGPLHINLSHTEGMCVVALSRMGAVGVDVEPLKRTLWADFDHSICSEEERREIIALPMSARNPALIALWTFKEALVKATGQGLRVPFSTICCAGSQGSAPYVRRTGALTGEPGEWSLHGGTLPGGFRWAAAQRYSQGIII